jgi:hypothetical protein
MGADRCVEWVGVVRDGVGRVELVAVLAVDNLVGQRREGGRVRQGERLHQPRLVQRLPGPWVPPELGVVVADHVDHPVPLHPGERPQRCEQVPVFGPGQGCSHQVPAAAGVPPCAANGRPSEAATSTTPRPSEHQARNAPG